MSNDFKYYFGFVVEEIFEPGHILKQVDVSTLGKFRTLTPESTLIDLNQHKLLLKLSESTRYLFRNAKRF